MIRGAIWWLEQWHAMNKHYDFYDAWDDSPEGAVASPFYFAMTGVFPAVFIGVSPYGHMQRATMNLEGYVARKAWNKSNIVINARPPFFHRRFTHSAGKRLILKGGAKLGARAIPYLGWALLAVDAWMVGKWIGEQTSPF